MNDCRSPRAGSSRRAQTLEHNYITASRGWTITLGCRAANWQAVMRDPAQLDPSIRAHLEAENAYAEAFMADTKELQSQLFAEMKGRIKEDDASVLAPDGPFAYYTRYVTGGQYPLFSRRPRDGEEHAIAFAEEAYSLGISAGYEYQTTTLRFTLRYSAPI